MIYVLSRVWIGHGPRWARDYTASYQRHADEWNRTHGPFWWRAWHHLRSSKVIL